MKYLEMGFFNSKMHIHFLSYPIHHCISIVYIEEYLAYGKWSKITGKQERREKGKERRKKKMEAGPLMEVIEWPWLVWLKITKDNSAIRMNVRI